VSWHDLSKPAGSSYASIYFAQEQGEVVGFLVEGFSNPRHAGIFTKWAASRMGVDISALDYIEVGA